MIVRDALGIVPITLYSFAFVACTLKIIKMGCALAIAGALALKI